MCNKKLIRLHRFVVTGLVAVFIVLPLMSCSDTGADSGDDAIMLYCAAGMTKPIEKIRQRYKEEYGIDVQIQYGGSGTLLSNIQIAETGDLYLAADDSYIIEAQSKGLVAESIPIAKLTPIIAVKKGNPKGIKGIDDLLRNDIAVGLANPDAAAVGRLAKKALESVGKWQAAESNVRVMKPTVTELATDVVVGAIDAAVIWDANANQVEGIEIIRADVLEAHSMDVTIGVLNSTEDATASLKFARYVTAADRGLENFETTGYEVVEGDMWDEHPRVVVFSGAMLQPGLEQTRKDFEAREGVSLDVSYNGCGVLVSQMTAGADPGAYVSCDQSFMDAVADRFLPARVLTENEMVILVEKGNPKNILRAKDLAREGINVGLAHPEKSALGKLSHDLLEQMQLLDGVKANLRLDSATGDFLVNQIRGGALDAVIVYRSNAMANPENLEKHLDLVELDSPHAIAVQPFAIAKSTKHRQLLKRFFERLQADESRARFESFGFKWRAN